MIDVYDEVNRKRLLTGRRNGELYRLKQLAGHLDCDKSRHVQSSTFGASFTFFASTSSPQLTIVTGDNGRSLSSTCTFSIA